MRAVRRPRKGEIWLAVHRFDNGLYYKRLTAEAFAVLQGLREGLRLDEALARGVEASEEPGKDWGPVVRGWFELWTRLGVVLCGAGAGASERTAVA